MKRFLALCAAVMLLLGSLAPGGRMCAHAEEPAVRMEPAGLSADAEPAQSAAPDLPATGEPASEGTEPQAVPDGGAETDKEHPGAAGELPEAKEDPLPAAASVGTGDPVRMPAADEPEGSAEELPETEPSDSTGAETAGLPDAEGSDPSAGSWEGPSGDTEPEDEEIPAEEYGTAVEPVLPAAGEVNAVSEESPDTGDAQELPPVLTGNPEGQESVPENESEELPIPEEGQIIAVFEDDESVICLPEADPNDPEAAALLDAYIEKILREALKHPGRLRSVRVDDGRLNETCLALYQQLKPQIEALAAGDRSSSEITVGYEDKGVSTAYTAAELGLTIKTNDDVQKGAELLKERLRINYPLVQLALLANCPYELYWYDKSTGARTTASPGMRCRYVGGEYVFEVTTPYRVRMTVSQDYQGDTYTVDTSVGRKVQGSVTTAQQIVEKYRDLNDLEKLNAYRDEICRLVSYNSAAAGGGQPYGDPWQLIYVFDEDSSTNVVCEGYAKAFQYLCDMTQFDGDVNCYTVSGKMEWGTGEGKHMWNIVTMSDGQNYLVDLTNSDAGAIGADGSLFLNGEAEDDGGAFIVRNSKDLPIRYEYNQDTTALYTGEELTLAGKKFEVTCHLDLYPHDRITAVEKVEPTCAEPGRAACWRCEQHGMLFADPRGAASVAEEDLYLPATGHAWGGWTQTTPPACEEAGEETRVCENDVKHVERRPVDALGHKLAEVAAVQPTRIHQGRKAHWVCETCGRLFADAGAGVEIMEGDTVLPKIERRLADTDIPSEDLLNGVEGWRIAHLDTLLEAGIYERFTQLPLGVQLAILLSALDGQVPVKAAAAAAETLAAEILDVPETREAIRRTYPLTAREDTGTLPAPVYEVPLVGTGDPAGKALVLVARNGTGGLICMYVGIESGRP